MNDSTPPTKTCERCGATLPPPGATGNPRRYCSGACRQAAYGARHPERVLANAAAWRARQPEKCLASTAAWRAAHREEQRAYDAARRADYLEEYRARDAAYAAAHREQGLARGRNRRARKRAAPGTHTAADVAAQYERQHGRCYWCKEKVGEAYHVDHVVPLSKGGGNGPENLVIACPACNLKKNARHPMDFAGILC